MEEYKEEYESAKERLEKSGYTVERAKKEIRAYNFLLRTCPKNLDSLSPERRDSILQIKDQRDGLLGFLLELNPKGGLESF